MVALVVIMASIAVALTVVAITVVYAQAWPWALVLLLSVLLRSVLRPRVLITPPAITALPPRSLVRTATIFTPLQPLRTHAIMAAIRAEIGNAEANARALRPAHSRCHRIS